MAHQTKPSRASRLILGAFLFIAGWYAGAYFQSIFNPPQTAGGFLFGAPTPTPTPKGWWER